MAWSYWHHGGANAWAESYPTACGNRQSPIDIKDWKNDTTLSQGSIRISYEAKDFEAIVNNGHSWQIRVATDGCSQIIAKHLSPSPFRLHQIHGHWGTGAHGGSEHQVNGQSYAAELHFVHFNTKYPDARQAATQPDGLAVLGVLLQETGADNPDLNALVNALRHVQYKDEEYEFVKHVLHPETWFPSKRTFYSYEGSLTTPPCSECVLWTVFEHPISISTSQLGAFRSLSSGKRGDKTACPLVNNVRPVQPLCGREIRLSASP